MTITIQLRAEAARALREAGLTPATEQLSRVLSEFDVSWKPLVSDPNDPQLSRYFTVEAPDAATAEKVIARLRQNEVVEAAYVKPAEGMP